jgi:outer membrane lipoprotein-sorting protein
MRMVRFLSPPDVKGTVTLLVEHSDKEDDIWVFLPALKKVRRLVASNKKDSFVGTDFSYGDVIGYKVSEWEQRLLPEEAVDGKPCYVIESTPKDETVKTNSGYSKRKSWIRKDNFVTVQGELWDPSGRPVKTFAASDLKEVDPSHGKWQPMRLEMANTQTGHKTVIRFENFKAGQGIKDEFFTTRYMEKE